MGIVAFDKVKIGSADARSDRGNDDPSLLRGGDGELTDVDTAVAVRDGCAHCAGHSIAPK